MRDAKKRVEGSIQAWLLVQQSFMRIELNQKIGCDE